MLTGNVLLALLAAVLWGGGDFSGGMGVKRAGGSLAAALRVVLLSHAASFLVLLLAAYLRDDPFPHGAVLAWGLAAGVMGGLALTAFYVALSRGAMGASAAVSGLMAAAIPAAVSIALDGSPGSRPLLGFAIAALAIWLIAAEPNPAPTTKPCPIHRGPIAMSGSPPMPYAESPCPIHRSPIAMSGLTPKTPTNTLPLAIAAGIGFGLYFVALKYAGPAGVIWPMATARMGSLTTCTLLFLALSLRSQKTPAPLVKMDRIVLAWAISTALLDTSGNLLFVAATRIGRLDVAAVLASLYPASTILLAAATQGERPTRRQALGMATAVLAVILIAL